MLLQLDKKVKLIFQNSGEDTIEYETDLKTMLEYSLEHFYELIEPPCTSASCNNESFNGCECGPIYEDYEIDSIEILD